MLTISLVVKTKAELESLKAAIQAHSDFVNDTCAIHEFIKDGQVDSAGFNAAVDRVVTVTHLLERVNSLDGSNLPNK